MATKITERAVKVAEGIIPKNSVHYTVYHDAMVGARVNATYADRFWLVLRKGGKVIHRESTQKRDQFNDWMSDIAAHGVAA